MGRVLHEKLQALAGAVENGRDPEPLFPAQPFRHLDEARSGRATREKVERNSAEREDVELLPSRTALGHGLGRHVDPGRFLHERVETARTRRRRSGSPGVERPAGPRLPVEDPDPRLRRVRVDHQDALRRQRTVDQALRMREVHGLGNLAEQVQAGIDIEGGGPIGEPVVESPGTVPVLEDQRRTENVLGITPGRENPLVPHVAQDFVLAPGCPLARRAVAVRSRRGHGVDSHPRPFAVDRRVAGRPVLVVRTFEQELVEPVVAHAPGTLRRPNAGFLHRPAHGPGQRTVGSRADRRAGAVPRERRDDPGPFVTPRSRIAEMHARTQILRNTAVDSLVRQEDVSLQEGRGRLPLERGLAPQERDQLLRFAVREQQRIVDRVRAVVVLAPPRPRALIAFHDSRAALDLDQVETLRRQHEQVDLVDRPVVGDELEVRPDAVGVVIGQPVAHERECVALPRELGVRDRLPAR